MIEEILTQYGVEPALIGALAGLMVFFVILALAAYVYMAIAMYTTAKKLKTSNAWLAWIPIGNLVLLSKMAQMHWWPVLLLLIMWIPVLNVFVGIAFAVFTTWWTWKVCERRKQPGWLSLFVFVPFLGNIWQFILWGILAWSDKPLIK